jgi:phospholipase C
LLVISPYAKSNFVDHSLTDQSSLVRFIEDNWLNGQRIGQGSFDAIAGPLDFMFDFDSSPNTTPFTLSESSGLPANAAQAATAKTALHFHSVKPAAGNPLR